ncbi:hypothetical protein COB21_00300 [Candidatus Aerophobetes bacterium]|uniref:Chromosomal replication initiator protein DnaA n=1 Tax=Aerophobetes bacterium TaxID=2030807 RepID=A0A2A4X829_UNCAE|nr:MAG: hypothetical protein COB21_00300 [Candidatus Aerophobetes bacterium]
MNQWLKFLKYLETRFDVNTIKQWVTPLKVVNFDARNIYLKAENQFQIAWFNEHIKQLCSEILLSSAGLPIKVHIICDKGLENKPTVAHKINENNFSPDFCDPLFTFDNFLAANKTLLSCQILKDLILNEKNQNKDDNNPIFIYGPPSSGKTHLLTAIALTLKAQGNKVCFVHALTFSKHVIHAFRGSLLQEFRQTYRNMDVLIIDDIHLLKRKTSSQEELFHTFNSLHTRKKRIIVSSNVIPSHLEEIEERLTSRFEWGISLAIEKPPSEILKQILGIKAHQLNLPLSHELRAWLLSQFLTPASLASALSTLCLYHHSNSPLEKTRAEFYLKDLILLEKSKTLTLDSVVRKVCSYYGIKNEDVLGRSQTKETSLPRQISMYLCREKIKTPYIQLGDFFNRDHSTVMTSVKSIKLRLKRKEPEVLTAIDKISQALL